MLGVKPTDSIAQRGYKSLHREEERKGSRVGDTNLGKVTH